MDKFLQPLGESLVNTIRASATRSILEPLMTSWPIGRDKTVTALCFENFPAQLVKVDSVSTETF